MKSYLFPDKANLGKRKTSVKKKTLSPSFNEILRVRRRSALRVTVTLSHARFVSDRRAADNRRAKSPGSLSLQYRVRMEYLRTQTLILSVWHHDTFGRNSFLGEVDVDLSKWDFDHAQLNDSALKPKVRRETHLLVCLLTPLHGALIAPVYDFRS